MVKVELRGIVTGLAILAALTLLAIGLDIQALDSLNSIRFHLAALMLVVPLALLLTGAPIRAAIMLALIVASVGQGALVIMRQQAVRAPLAAQETDGRFTLLNYNVLSRNMNGDEAADSIIAAAPDLAVVMEAPGIAPYFERLQETFPYHVGCDGSVCDLMLLSRTPLLDAEIRPLGPLARQRLIIARTEIEGRMVTVVAVHLSKPYFDENAWAELREVGWALSRIEGPVVVSGDFNASAWSEAISSFAEREGLVPPPRYPGTWPVLLGELGVPIDNIFTRGGLLIEDIAATPPHGSNHRGLLAHIAVKPAP